MKITLLSFTRFIMYDQAEQLEKRGWLYKIITNYPKFKVEEFCIPKKRIISLLYTGVLHRLWMKYGHKLSIESSDKLMCYLHNYFSKQSARYIKNNEDIIIGLSSYCYEGLIKAKEQDSIAIVDHGSLHLKSETEVLKKEYDKYDIPLEERSFAQDWIIKKQDSEFAIADYIFLGSKLAKKTFLEQGYDDKKLIVNNYGVNLNSFRKVAKKDTAFRIVYCGGLNIRKGVHYLLKAFNELSLSNVELWLIGANEIKDPALLSVIEKMNINFENIYFRGSFPQNELYKEFSQGSIFVFPSLADGFALVVVQALACGLPVVVTDTTGAKDFVTDGENGYIIPSQNIKAIKEKILYLYQSPNVVKSMSEQALLSVQRGVSWNAYGKRLVKHLTTLSKDKEW